MHYVILHIDIISLVFPQIYIEKLSMYLYMYIVQDLAQQRYSRDEQLIKPCCTAELITLKF